PVAVLAPRLGSGVDRLERPGADAEPVRRGRGSAGVADLRSTRGAGGDRGRSALPGVAPAAPAAALALGGVGGRRLGAGRAPARALADGRFPGHDPLTRILCGSAPSDCLSPRCRQTWTKLPRQPPRPRRATFPPRAPAIGTGMCGGVSADRLAPAERGDHV